jgi:DNA polymerase I-like protein with 3'-5' exonuclease and polymerase domains
MLYSIDVETVCNKEGCPHIGTAKKCDHALHFKRNRITVAAIYWQLPDGTEKYRITRDFSELEKFIEDLPESAEITGHNFKFDAKTIFDKMKSESNKEKLVRLWKHDSLLLATAYSEKVSKEYLEAYELKRKELKGGHRQAGGYSLKVLAPYFLGVAPFWETDNHDNDEYVLKDAKYTYLLTQDLLKRVHYDGVTEFYQNKLLPWVKNLFRMEIRGIELDFDKMNAMEAEVKAESERLEKIIKEQWAEGFKAYEAKKKQELILEYRTKIDTAIERTRNTKAYEKLSQAKRETKLDEVIKKGLENLDKKLEALEPLNLESDQQVLWLFQEYLGYQCDGSVGKDTKEKLIIEGKEDVVIYDQWTKQTKLLTSFFPSYREMAVEGVLYCTFNPDGTRTGRLSSSNPNLQQVPRKIRSIFKPRRGYKFSIRDMSAVEPNLIGFFSEDPILCNLLIRGDNFHNYATKSMLEYVTCPLEEVKKKYPRERDCIKQVDLSIFYGTGRNGMMKTVRKHRFDWTEAEANQRLRKYKNTFKRVFQFKEELDSILIDNSVTNIMGRKYRLEDPSEIYMKGFNTLIQGSASDLVINSAYKFNIEAKNLGLDAHVLLVVHDEIVIEAREDQAEVADKLLNDLMTYYKLETIHGAIKLQTEGGISDVWAH